MGSRIPDPNDEGYVSWSLPVRAGSEPGSRGAKGAPVGLSGLATGSTTCPLSEVPDGSRRLTRDACDDETRELKPLSTETLTKDPQRVSKASEITASGVRLERPASRRPLWRDRTLRRWLAAWVGAPVLAIVNGAAREFAYKDQVGESAANQVSVAPLIALLGLYFWILQRRWPLATTRDALSVGAIWVALSVFFEFGFGHYVEGDSWSDLFQTYNVAEGNIWILILIWIAVGPAIARAVTAERSADSRR